MKHRNIIDIKNNLVGANCPFVIINHESDDYDIYFLIQGKFTQDEIDNFTADFIYDSSAVFVYHGCDWSKNLFSMRASEEVINTVILAAKEIEVAPQVFVYQSFEGRL